MGYYQLVRSHSDQQVPNCFASSPSSSLCSEMQRRCSKTQNCLLKILRIISTIPPENTSTGLPSLSSEKLNGFNRFAIDLNIGFNVPAESGSPVAGGWVSGQSTRSASGGECGGVLTVDVGKCSEDGECEKGEEEKSCKSDSYRIEANRILQSETNESKEEIGELKEQQGFMGLLIEAATLIFGEFKDENPKCETERKIFKSEKLKMDEDDDVAAKRRNNECRVETMVDKSTYPLVRSKRGRIQVLPNKYKDSIIEPFSRTRSTIVSNRRRSK